MKLWIVLTVLAMAGLAFSKAVPVANAPPSYHAHECQDLDQPNAVYHLVSDVSGYSIDDPCFDILADNVTLDCHGHTIYFTMLETGWFASVIRSNGHSRSAIRNCVVDLAGWTGYGVALEHSQGSSIINCSFFGTNFLGSMPAMMVYASNGVSIKGNYAKLLSFDAVMVSMSNGTKISGNRLITNSGRGGNDDSGLRLEFCSGPGLLVENNTFNSSSEGFGISAKVVKGGVFSGNAVSGGTGFYLGQGHSNIISGNTISSHGSMSNQAGIIIRGPGNSNSIFGNSVSSVTDGARVDCSGYVNGCGNNSISANGIFGKNASVALVCAWQGCNDTAVIGNRLSSDGTAVRIGQGGNGTRVIGNRMAAPVWVENSGTESVFSDAVQGNTYYAHGPDGYVAAWVLYDICDSSGDRWADGGSDLPFSPATAPTRWKGAGSDFHPFTGKPCTPPMPIKKEAE